MVVGVGTHLDSIRDCSNHRGFLCMGLNKIMKNANDLPDWLVKSVSYLNSQYNPGSGDYTATSLLKPPMLYGLEWIHKEEIEEDVVDNLASFHGTAVHNAIEDALKDDDRYIVEERFYRKIKVPDAPGKQKTFTVSGQIDLYDRETKQLSDHKTTSIFKLVVFEDHHDYEAQCAINRWIMQGNGFEVESVAINGFPKDWRRGESKKSGDYPDYPFFLLELPNWSTKITEDFIRHKIIEKEWAKLGSMRTCTKEERWQRESKWAVMKAGRKSAVRLLDSKEEAEEYIKEKGLDKKVHYLEERKAEANRCDNFCPVATWCEERGPISG